LSFTTGVIKITVKLNKTYTGRHIGGQLMRSATSAGANYEEACGAESRQDFIHKMQVVLKELRESLYWLRLIKKSEINKTKMDIGISRLLIEARELANIIAKSVVTAKNRN